MTRAHVLLAWRLVFVPATGPTLLGNLTGEPEVSSARLA
jgi:hypothetical protein